jgi:uncharacterized cupredoxin-like copper-binding protein
LDRIVVELARVGIVVDGAIGAFGVTLKPGEYDVICTIPGHAEKGMKGTLTVK